ncbi:MAG: DUF4215 domain-containing protein [bacterium]
MRFIRPTSLLALAAGLAWAGCLVDFGSPGTNHNDAGPGADAAPRCGDGVLNAGEVCDGTLLGGSSCVDLGYESGTLDCDGWCQHDESACVAAPVCGDGVRDGTELCDDGDAIEWDGCTGCVITEFRVNPATAGNQVQPALIPLDEGFLAVWSDDISGSRLLAQRFDSFATADGTPCLVSTTATMNGEVNRAPAAAKLSDGSFVVVWIRESVAEQRVVGRLFDSLSEPIGVLFDVSDYAPEGDDSPSVAATAGGGFVAAWRSVQSGTGRILMRRFAFDAVPLAASVRADEVVPTEPFDPRVAVASGGSFLVVWTDEGSAGASYVNGHHLLADGTPNGAVFPVPDGGPGWHASPDVAATPSGGFVVVWAALLAPATGSWDIFLRRFDETGAPVEQDKLVNAELAADQLRPAVAVGPTGVLVAWETQVGADWDLAARVLDFSGVAQSVELTTHVHLEGWQTSAAVTTTSLGNHFVVAWQSDLQDGSLWGVYAQRFTTDGSPLGVGQ